MDCTLALCSVHNVENTAADSAATSAGEAPDFKALLACYYFILSMRAFSSFRISLMSFLSSCSCPTATPLYDTARSCLSHQKKPQVKTVPMSVATPSGIMSARVMHSVWAFLG